MGDLVLDLIAAENGEESENARVKAATSVWGADENPDIAPLLPGNDEAGATAHLSRLHDDK